MCKPNKPLKLQGITGIDTYINPDHIIRTDIVKPYGYYQVTLTNGKNALVNSTPELMNYLGELPVSYPNDRC